MKILFIGGCLLTTKTVASEKRFINILRSRNPHWKIILARYASFSLLEEIFSAAINEDLPDAVVMLIRPFPFYTLCKPFPRVPGIKGRIEIKMHPRFFFKKEWFVENDRLIVEMDWNPNGTKRTMTHSVNLSLGKIFGFDKWAVEYVKRKIFSISDACRKKDIQFTVVGSPEVKNNEKERQLILTLNEELIKTFSKEKITYVNLFSKDFPDSMLGPDKVHYNDEGHFQLTKKIEEELIMIRVRGEKK
jgi:hypothetical protein